MSCRKNLIGVVCEVVMAYHLSRANVVDSDEAHLREIECELEFAQDLLGHDETTDRELLAAVEEAMTFRRETGIYPWQSVAAFKNTHPKDWKRISHHPRIEKIARSFDHRFGLAFSLSAWQPRETVDAVDDAVHVQALATAKGMRDLFYFANQKRRMWDSGEPLSMSDAAEAVETRAISSVWDSSTRQCVAVILMTTSPIVTDLGQLDESKHEKLGQAVAVGPLYAQLGLAGPIKHVAL